MEESKMKTLKNMKSRLFSSTKTLGLFIGVALLSASCSGFLDVPGDPDTPLMGVSDSSGNSGTVLLHEGTTKQVGYKLNKRPTAPVTFTVELVDASASGAATMTTTTLTFTPDNWSEEQYVSISLPKDDVTDGNKNASVTFSPAVSSDPAYSGYVRPSQPVALIDIDSDGVVVTPTQLQTSEASVSATKTFQVVLNSKPAADVTINLTSEDTSEGTINKNSLTFTNATWNTAQTVTVTPVDDDLLDGNVSYQITLSNTTSTDTDYNGLVVSNVQVTNIDNEVPAISVIKTVLEMDEGQTESFTVTLSGGRPASDVVISLTNPFSTRAKLQNVSNTDITQLTFTPSDFSGGSIAAIKTVKVVAIDNHTAHDDDVTGMVELKLTSNNYGNIDPDDVKVTIRDNDTPGFIISNMSKALTEDGGTGQFTIKLKSPPTHDVTLRLVEDTAPNESCNEGRITYVNGTATSGCSTSTTVTKTITFTSSNWDTEQTVVLQGVNDDIDDGNTQYTLKILPDTTTADTLYKNLDPADVSVNNNNDDTAGFVVVANNKVDGSTTTYTIEDKSIYPIDGFATDDSANLDPATYSQFKIKLSSQPTVPTKLTLTINSSSGDGVFVSNNSATLTLSEFQTTEGGTDGWNVDRTVKIKGASNGANEGNHDYTVSVAVSFASGTDAKYSDSSKVFRPTFRIYSCDNDVANEIIGCRRSGMFATSEAGGKAKVWFITKNAPTSTVTLPVSSNQEDPANLPSGVTTAEGKVINGGGGAASGSPVASANALITTSNWNTMTSTSTNFIEAQGIDDSVFDANVVYNLATGTPTSGGATYTGFTTMPDVAIHNIDNEEAFVIVRGNTSENENNGTFQIKLGTNPTHDVKVTIACSNTGDECNSVSPTALTFTSTNWNTNQTITVVGKNDHQADGPQNIYVKFKPLDTQDERLKGIQSPEMVAAINADNDRLIWVTNTKYYGNLNANAVSDVDAKCAASASDANRPSGSASSTDTGWFTTTKAYKALVAYSTSRRATSNGTNNTGQSDWVLQPNTEYYLKTGSGGAGPYTTKLFKTDANGLIPFNMTNAFAGSGHWTGLNTDMTTDSLNTCSDWKDDSANGAYGSGSATNSSALRTSTAACSTSTGTQKSFICVQQ